MDHNKDGNDIKPTPTCSRVTTNEETGENEREYDHNPQQYRNNEELFASDEESDESNKGDKSINELSADISMHTNLSFSEHFNSISFYDCEGKISSVLPLNEVLDNRNDEKYLLEDCEEALRRLDEVCINSDLSKSPSSNEKDSEKTRMSPDFADVTDCSSSKENKNSSFRIKKSKSFYPEHSDHPIVTLESSSSEKDENSPMSPQSILKSLYPNFGRPTETSPQKACESSNAGIYGMISSPISSNYINLGNTQSSQDPSNSNTLNSPIVENSENSKTLRGIFSRSCEFPTSSKRNIYCTKYCQQLNTDTTPNSSIRNADEAFPAPNSKILRSHFSSSWELPRTSNHTDFCKQRVVRCNTYFSGNFRQSTACHQSSSNNRNECISSLSDLPSTSRVTPQRYPADNHLLKRISTSARKLVFDDPDPSSDDGKDLLPVEKERRKRKKTKRLRLPDSSENPSSRSKTDTDENVSRNEPIIATRESSPSSSEDSPRKSLKLDETASTSNTRSVRNVNSEGNEAHQSSRKRLISNSRASSDIEQSDAEHKRNKKFKKSPSSD